jgi:gas vesicle protein
MKGSNGRLAFGAFMGGVGLGMLMSMLFASQSGEETRELLAEKARQVGHAVGDTVIAVSDAVDDLRTDVAETVQDTKTRVGEAVEVGKKAYRREIARGTHA